MVSNLYEEYFTHYNRFGAIPAHHYFVNHQEQDIRNKMASLLHPREEISTRWKEKYSIESQEPGMVFLNDVDSTLSYYELKKILIIQNELVSKLNNETDPVRLSVLQKRFLELRGVEREILKKHNTVVFKSLKYK